MIGYDEIGKFSLVKHQNREETSGGGPMVPIAGQAELELVLDDVDFVRLSRDPTFKLTHVSGSLCLTRILLDSLNSLAL